MEAEKLIKTKDLESLHNLAELVGLVDGAYEIVFMYIPQSPSQKKWKEDWLEKAKKYGAGFDD